MTSTSACFSILKTQPQYEREKCLSAISLGFELRNTNVFCILKQGKKTLHYHMPHILVIVLKFLAQAKIVQEKSFSLTFVLSETFKSTQYFSTV